MRELRETGRPFSPLADPRASSEVRRTITQLLRWGAGISAGLCLIGLVAYLAEGGVGLLVPPDRLEPGTLLANLIHPTAESWILVGLLVLVFTPVARVLFMNFAFARARDRPFAALTLLVLLILATSVVVGAWF